MRLVTWLVAGFVMGHYVSQHILAAGQERVPASERELHLYIAIGGGFVGALLGIPAWLTERRLPERDRFTFVVAVVVGMIVTTVLFGALLKRW